MLWMQVKTLGPMGFLRLSYSKMFLLFNIFNSLSSQRLLKFSMTYWNIVLLCPSSSMGILRISQIISQSPYNLSWKKSSRAWYHWLWILTILSIVKAMLGKIQPQLRDVTVLHQHGLCEGGSTKLSISCLLFSRSISCPRSARVPTRQHGNSFYY